MKRFLVALSFLFLCGSWVLAAQDTRAEIFVTSWCPYCRQLEAFLKKNQISYTRYDVEKNEKGYRLFRELGGDGVPMTRIGDEVIHGYDPERISASLKKRF